MRHFCRCIWPIVFFIIFTSFSLLSQQNYYWVGGSGNWSDLAHWATTPGGTTTHLQVPTPLDNVIFDEHSFTAPGQTVTVNVSNAVCRDMDWSDALYTPTLEGASNLNFRIYGSLTLISGMYFDFQGYVTFEATTTGHHITTAGHSFHRNIYFHGTGGEWSLTDALFVGYKLEQTSGTIITNDNDISCTFFESYNNNTRFLDLGASIITISGSSSQSWSVGGNNLNFNAGTSLIRFTSSNVPSIRHSSGLVFYDIEFLSPEAYGTITTSAENATFNSITFHGHGNIQGNQTVGTLIFSENKVYTIEGNKTIHILNDLQAVSTCYMPIILKSSDNGTAAYISKTTGSITVESVFMKDIHAIGGAIFTANNAVDMGNNTGWVMHTVSSQDLYWVGGSGDWGSPTNWSYSTGGPGGACVPSPYDNVIFDENSFSAAGETVTINLPMAFCKDMIWTDALYTPTFSSTTNELHIYGSLWLSPSMDMHLYGNVILKAQTPQTIRTAGNLILCDFIFDGAGGEWLFEDDFSSLEVITVSLGTLNTNSQNVMCQRFRSPGFAVRGIVLGSSVITLTSNSNALHMQNNNLFFDAGTSLIRFVSNVNPGMSHSNNLTFYNVEFTNADGLGEVKIMNNASFNSLSFAGNGLIAGSHNYGTLTFSQGKNYEISSGSTQTIVTAFNATGTCAEPITIKSTTPSDSAILHKSSGSVTTNYLILKDIHATGGATFVADNTVDLGNNTGWTLNAPSPQTLYWVGGSGNWSDPNHWATTSGGAGGSCIPTPYDNVVFDHNSFTALNQTVYIDIVNANCYDMTWTNGVDPFVPELEGPFSRNINIYGSLVLATAMDINFIGYVYFEATTPGKTITTNGNYFRRLVLNGVGGSWSLLDDLSCMMLYINNGSFFTNGHNMWISGLSSSGSNLRTIDLGSSEITINGGLSAWYVRSTNLTFNAGTSLIRFTGTLSGANSGINRSDSLNFHVVEFTNPDKSGELRSMTGAHFNKLIFRGGGIITGEHTYDTLVFAPGKWYLLEENKIQVITNKFSINGNGCYPITIQSLSSGTQAYITKTSGTVAGDYLELRDINASGGASFYAGSHSTDMGNNSGWVFSNAPNYVFGLPNDSVICPGDTIILNTDNFFGGSSYLWNDGSTDSTLVVTAPGTYWVRVTYPNSCFIADTISLELCSDSIHLSFNYGHEGCQGHGDGWAVAYATGDTAPFTYTWSNGSTNDSIYGLTSGVYIVTVTSSTGSSVIDSIEISYTNAAPEILAGNDTAICAYTTLSLAEATASHYSALYWTTTGSGNFDDATVLHTEYTPSASDISAGNVLLILTATGIHPCPDVSDTLALTIYPLPVAEAGHDTQICEGSSTQLNASGGMHYQWTPPVGLDSIHKPNPIASPLTTTTYTVTVEDANGCTASDDIVVEVLTFSFDSGQGGTICEGGSYQLNADSTFYCEWTPALTLDNPKVHNPIATPNATTTYYVSAYMPSDNLIFNSDFSLGNTGFDTDYVHSSNLQEGEYYITTNPNYYHPSFAPCGDNTTGSGNMMVINGSNILNQKVWCQTISVMPHTYYAFSTWATSVHPGSPAILQFSINDAPLGTPFYLTSTTCLWNQFFEVWYSGSDTVAVICITNQNTAFSGNDFALDDLSFSMVCQYTDSVEVVVEDNYYSGNYHLLCGGDSLIWQGQTYTSSGYHYDTLQTIHGCDSVLFIHLTFFDSYEFIESDSICSGDTLTWRGQNYYHNGIYYDSLVTVNGCDSVYVLNLIVSNNPLPHISGPDTICLGDTTLLMATGGDFYEWSTGAQTQTINVSPSSNTSFTVTVSNTAGCSAIIQHHIIVAPLPIADAGPSQSLCANDSVHLHGSGGGSFLWSTGDTTAMILVSPLLTTDYHLTVTNDYGCADTSGVTVTVFPLPDANAGEDTLICHGEQLQLTGSGGVSYEWSPSQYLSSTTIANPVATPQSNITYTLTVTDSMGCTNTDSIALGLLPAPHVFFTPTTFSGCPPLTIQFSDSSCCNISSWAWNFGDPASTDNTSTLQNPVFTYHNPGSFTVSLTATNDEGCHSTAVVNNTVTVYQNPLANFYAVPSKADMQNPHIDFYDTSIDAVFWQWNFGDVFASQNTSEQQNPSHTYSQEGTYTVTLTVTSDEGCPDSTQNTVVIEPAFHFYIPNAFSPNGDGINDTFGGKGSGFTDYKLYIFSRWGDLVYKSDDYNKPWNGKFQNKNDIHAPSVFVYKIIVTDFSGEKHTYMGHVTLLK